jgi:hypothetical protein
MHSPKMVAARKSLSAHSANINVQRLVAEGCDDAMLLNSIAFARLLPDLYPPLAASRLRRLAIKLDEVLREMKALTPSIELPFIVDEREDGSAGFKMEPTGGDLHLWPEVEKDLQTKVACLRCSCRDVDQAATANASSGTDACLPNACCLCKKRHTETALPRTMQFVVACGHR